MIEELLDVAALDLGPTPPADEPFDLPGLLNEVDAQLRPRAEARGLTYRSVRDPDLPRHVRGDPRRLRHLLHRLIDNAIEHSPRGAIAFHSEAGERLRRLPGGGDLPIIGTSASLQPDETRLMDEAGMNAHVAKPIDFPRLFALILQLHGQRRDAVRKAG